MQISPAIPELSYVHRQIERTDFNRYSIGVRTRIRTLICINVLNRIRTHSPMFER